MTTRRITGFWDGSGDGVLEAWRERFLGKTVKTTGMGCGDGEGTITEVDRDDEGYYLAGLLTDGKPFTLRPDLGAL